MHFFEEIKEYVGFTSEDADRLKEMHPVVEPHFSEIVVDFYDALMQNPRARGVFEGPEQIQRLRRSLQRWLNEVFQGPHNTSYFERRLRIGAVHVNVGLLPQFMFGAMNIIRVGLVKIITKREMSDDQRFQWIESIERILDIELTIMLQSYWDTLMAMKLQVPAALATGLAHEIRNPLNAIGLQLTLLERKLRNKDVDSNVYQPVMDAMRSELRRIQGLNSEILDFARPVELHLDWADANEIIDELTNGHGLTLEAGNIEFKSTVSGSPKIWCDRDRLNQVLVNMLTNAVEAMGEQGNLELSFNTTDSGTIIDFKDSGKGMSPTLKYRVFDLFFTTRASGTGIGLPIARKIIEAHGGSIDVNSRVGEGTTFSIYLPRPDEEPKEMSS